MHRVKRARRSDLFEERSRNQLHKLDEGVGNAAEACLRIEKSLREAKQEDARKQLLYELQKQRLLFSRYRLQRLALLKKLAESDVHTTSKLRSHSVATSHESLLTQQDSAASGHSVPVGYSTTELHEESSTVAGPNLRAKQSFDYSSATAGWRGDDAPLMEQDKEDIPFEHHARRHSVAGCDTFASAANFLQYPLSYFTTAKCSPGNGEEEEKGSSSFDHREETKIGTKVKEIALLGAGPEGSSASSTLERNECIVDERQMVSEMKVRFVHEHVLTYRLETVLNLPHARWPQQDQETDGRDEVQLPKDGRAVEGQYSPTREDSYLYQANDEEGMSVTQSIPPAPVAAAEPTKILAPSYQDGIKDPEHNVTKAEVHDLAPLAGGVMTDLGKSGDAGGTSADIGGGRVGGVEEQEILDVSADDKDSTRRVMESETLRLDYQLEESLDRMKKRSGALEDAVSQAGEDAIELLLHLHQDMPLLPLPHPRQRNQPKQRTTLHFGGSTPPTIAESKRSQPSRATSPPLHAARRRTESPIIMKAIVEGEPVGGTEWSSQKPLVPVREIPLGVGTTGHKSQRRANNDVLILHWTEPANEMVWEPLSDYDFTRSPPISTAVEIGLVGEPSSSCTIDEGFDGKEKELKEEDVDHRRSGTTQNDDSGAPTTDTANSSFDTEASRKGEEGATDEEEDDFKNSSGSSTPLASSRSTFIDYGNEDTEEDGKDSGDVIVICESGEKIEKLENQTPHDAGTYQNLHRHEDFTWSPRISEEQLQPIEEEETSEDHSTESGTVGIIDRVRHAAQRQHPGEGIRTVEVVDPFDAHQQGVVGRQDAAIRHGKVDVGTQIGPIRRVNTSTQSIDGVVGALSTPVSSTLPVIFEAGHVENRHDVQVDGPPCTQSSIQTSTRLVDRSVDGIPSTEPLILTADVESRMGMDDERFVRSIGIHVAPLCAEQGVQVPPVRQSAHIPIYSYHRRYVRGTLTAGELKSSSISTRGIQMEPLRYESSSSQTETLVTTADLITQMEEEPYERRLSATAPYPTITMDGVEYQASRETDEELGGDSDNNHRPLHMIVETNEPDPVTVEMPWAHESEKPIEEEHTTSIARIKKSPAAERKIASAPMEGEPYERRLTAQYPTTAKHGPLRQHFEYQASRETDEELGGDSDNNHRPLHMIVETNEPEPARTERPRAHESEKPESREKHVISTKGPDEESVLEREESKLDSKAASKDQEVGKARKWEVKKIPCYVPPPIVELDDEKLVAGIMSPRSILDYIFEKHFFATDANWKMPYFLVAKGFELLEQKWPIRERVLPPWFLKAALDVILRSRVAIADAAKEMHGSSELRLRHYVLESEELVEAPHIWPKRTTESESPESDELRYVIIRQDPLSEGENDEEGEEYATVDTDEPTPPVKPQNLSFYYANMSPPMTLQRHDLKRVASHQRSEELAEVLAKRRQRLEDIERRTEEERQKMALHDPTERMHATTRVRCASELLVPTAVETNQHQRRGSVHWSPEEIGHEGQSSNFNLRRAVLRRGEGAVLHHQESTRFFPVGRDEWEQARKALKHVSDPDHQLESKRRRLVGEESRVEASPSERQVDDVRHDPYVRSASALFKLLDKDYLQRHEQANRLGTEPPSFTLRFLQPAKLTATGGRIYPAMPELHDGLLFQNGVGLLDGVEDSLHLGSPESDQSMKWDPTRLLSEKLYKVDWNPLVEKRSRFRNMEGHLEVPNLDGNIVPEVEPEWKKLYFRTSMGRFQWFASHCADEHPIGDVLLTGTTVTTDRDEWTIEVRGGKESANIRVRVPSHCWDKWLQALLSHSNSKLIDAYVQPVFPAVPHYTERVVLIDLGMCSVRAGLLTNRPALPQSFFPAVGCVMPTGEVHVGVNALKPEVRQHGLLQSPIQSASSANPIERYKLNKQVLEAVIAKIVADLRVDPTQYKVLLSIPQNVPTVFVGDLLRMLINQFNFKAASVTRHPSLILYSYDVTSGVVVDIGERLNIVPVIDEFIVDSGVISLPFGAQQIRDSLRRKLAAQNGGVNLLSSAVEQIFLRHILEQACYVATDYDAEEAKDAAEEVKVNFDKFKIGPGMESATFVVDGPTRFQSTEGLFQPKKWGLEIKGIAKLIHDSIQLSPIDSRRTLYRNVYLSGGTSLLPGLAERLETELCKIAPSSIFVQVQGSPWRYHSAYLGAHIIANSHQFESCCADATNLDKYIKQMEAYTT